MGKQAATKVLAGAEETGAGAHGDPGPALRVVVSPKRQQILEGMMEVVGRYGYEAASVQKVLDLTGLYRQAFYDSFEDVEACYLAALDLSIAQVEALVRAAAASEESWRGQLRAGLTALLEQLEQDPGMGRALIVEVHAAGPAALSRRSDAMKRVTDFIDSARGEVEGDEAPPPIAAEGIVAGMHSVVHAKLAAGDVDGFRALLPDFMYFAALPYFGPETAEQEMQAAKA